jgi:hypothetical protein
MLKKEEYRYHYLNVLPEENNQEVWNYINSMAEKEREEDDDREDYDCTFGNFQYAIGQKNNDGGDSHDNPNIIKMAQQLSEKFPKFDFEYGWTNGEYKEDKQKFVFKAGKMIKSYEYKWVETIY